MRGNLRSVLLYKSLYNMSASVSQLTGSEIFPIRPFQTKLAEPCSKVLNCSTKQKILCLNLWIFLFQSKAILANVNVS